MAENQSYIKSGCQNGPNSTMIKPIFGNASTTIINLPSGSSSQVDERDQKAIAILRRELAEVYLDLRLPRVSWLDDRELPINEYFAHLSLQLDEDESDIELTDIFSLCKEGVNNKIILIQGQRGYGKTTLLTKIAYDWAIKEPYVSHFHLLFFICLRDLEKMTLKEMIDSQCTRCCGKDFQQVFDHLKLTDQKIVILLDALGEMWCLRAVNRTQIYP